MLKVRWFLQASLSYCILPLSPTTLGGRDSILSLSGTPPPPPNQSSSGIAAQPKALPVVDSRAFADAAAGRRYLKG